MKKLAKWGLCVLALVCAFGLGRGKNAYTESDLAHAREEAYNRGYHTGYEEGLTAEQAALYEEAFAAGRSVGYDAGLTEGLAQGEAAREEATLSAFPSLLPTDDPAQEEPAVQTVYVTKSGSKYHLDGCRHLKSKIQKTLEEAKALGLEPCKVCNPPK